MPETHAVAVCGFGRCGSTMTMSMLVAGGLPPGNADDPPYEGDPRGLYGRDLTGTCVKLLDPGDVNRVFAGPTPRWRFVWLDRDPYQQALSFLKFVRALEPLSGVTVPDSVTARMAAASYDRDRPARLAQLRRAGPVLVLDYERVLARPRKAAALLRREIWPSLDVDAAAAIVHQRDGRCRPDLAAESFTFPPPAPTH